MSWNLVLIILIINLNYCYNDSQNECNIINNEYCIHKPNKDDCTATIIYPYTCANQPDESSCDFFLDWNIINQDLVKFTLSKYNYKFNQWFALIFSQSNNSNSEIESDIVISILSNENRPKIVNGIVKGSDVILIDDLEQDSSSSSQINDNDKKILYEKITLNANFVDIEFSVKLTSNSSIKLDNCNSNFNDGFYIFLMNGLLDNKDNILFETASIPKSLGPFCLNKCSNLIKQKSMLLDDDNFSSLRKNLNRVNEDLPSSSSTQVSQVTLSTIISTSSSSTSSNTQTTVSTTITSTSTTSTNTQSTNKVTESKDSTTIKPSTIDIKFPSIQLTTLEETKFSSSQTTFNKTTITQPTITDLTKSETKMVTTETRTLTSTSTFFSNSTTLTTTSTTSTTTETTTTTLSSTTTTTTTSITFNQNICKNDPVQISNKNNYNLTIESLYNKLTDRLSFIINFYITNQTGRMAVFVNNLESNSEKYLVYGELKQSENLNKTLTNLEESKEIESSISYTELNSTRLIFSLPRNLKLSNQVYFRDCISFNFYYSNSLDQISQNDFLAKPSSFSSLSANLNSFCINTCGLSTKNTVEFFLSFKFDKIKYDPEFANLNSTRAINLNNDLKNLFDNVFKLSNSQYQLKNFNLMSIKNLVPKNKRFARQINSNGLSVESKISVLSDNSDSLTKKNCFNDLNKILVNNNDLGIKDLSLIDSISPESTASPIATSTLKPKNTEYPKTLALALVFSLLATTGVLGGALFFYHRWRTSKMNGNNQSTSSGRTIRFAMPNRRAKYESQMVRLDGIPDNNYTNDDFELNFNNPNFESENQNGNYYTDFTGSREVGIDVGDQPPMDEIDLKTEKLPDGLDNLRIVIKECIQSDLKLKFLNNEKKQDDQIKILNKNEPTSSPNMTLTKSTESEPKVNLYRANKFENLNMQNDDDDLNFDYFNEYKQKQDLEQLKREEINLNLNSNTELFDGFINSDNIDLSIKAEEEEDVTDEMTDIFSKDIEENLPELFGEYKKNTNEINSEPKRQANNSSPNLRAPAPLGFSSNSKLEHETSNSNKNSSLDHESFSLGTANENVDEDDFTPIDKNAFKNFRIETNNTFVLDDSKSNLKEFIKNSKTDLFSSQMTDSKLNDNDLFLNTEIPKPRVCKLKINPNFSGLGIHLCDNKSHMVKDIEKYSPADLGGLKPGDKILLINKENVENSSYLDVVNKLKEALVSSLNDEIDLVVMNAIEYNLFKANDKQDLKQSDSGSDQFAKDSLNEFENDNEKKSIYEFSLDKPHTEVADFNPFEDISNEMFTPFLHYTSIPPPETFQQTNTDISKPPDFDQFETNNIRDDSLEESTTDSLSSSLDTNNQKKDNSNNMNNNLSFNNANEFDFNFNFDSNFDTKFEQNLFNQTPSISLFNETKEFKTQPIWGNIESNNTDSSQVDYMDILTENSNNNNNSTSKNNINSNKSTPQLRKRF